MLQAKGHEIDYDHWHAFVHHELPYSELLHPDRRTREILNALDVPCHIFTNADRKHAEICLRHLGIEQCFQVRPVNRARAPRQSGGARAW